MTFYVKEQFDYYKTKIYVKLTNPHFCKVAGLTAELKNNNLFIFFLTDCVEILNTSCESNLIKFRDS